MSLYRTWRPKSFIELVGQDAVVRTLRTALTGGRLAHAYLFSGPRGSGKTSAAKIFARCLNCAAGPTADPDNTCEHCTAMIAGTGLDVLEIDAASNRGIDEIRALRDAVKFAPAAMRYKIFIVDEAHMLTREGANAFLKTLEEPPAHAVFILATTAPEQLPVTILSRCQRYAFRRIPVATMIERMRTIANAERIVIDDAALSAIAYRADGGLRDALTMLEQAASFASGPIDAIVVEDAFGASGRAFAHDLARCVLGGDAAGALRAIEAASDAGADMQAFTRNILAEYRNVLVARIDPDLLARDLSSVDAQAAAQAAEAAPQVKVVRALRLFADAAAAGRASGNPRLELDLAVLRLTVQGEDPTLDALATRVALLEQRGEGGAAKPATQTLPSVPSPGAAEDKPKATQASPSVPSPGAAEDKPKATQASPSVPSPGAAEDKPKATQASPSVSSPGVAEDKPKAMQASPSVSSPGVAEDKPTAKPAAAAPPEATLQRAQSLWPNIRTRAEAEKVTLRAPLARASVDALSAGAIVVRMTDEVNAGILRDQTAIMERAIKEVMGVPLRLQVIVRVESAGSKSAVKRVSAASSGLEAENGETDLLAYALQKIAPADY